MKLNLTYKSFYWSLGTTSFRTKNLNKKIELQLKYLKDFWNLTENQNKNWIENDVIQTKYYDYLHNLEFITGNAPNKAKDAREKTAGLVSLGLIDNDRKLTEAGNELLKLSQNNDFEINNNLQLPADSFIYFKQLLKTSIKIEKSSARPFLITVYLIEKLNGLSYDEFTYILPLCVDKNTVLNAVENIKSLREDKTTVDDIIFNILMKKDNYKTALKYFIDSEFVDENVIAEIGINRKSRNYDKKYLPLYLALYEFYIAKNENAINEIIKALPKLSNTKLFWQQYLFGKNNFNKVTNSPLKYLQTTKFNFIKDETEFRKTFFSIMHIIKTKQSLTDYFDLNRRYMNTTDAILFEDEKVIMDIIPKYYFEPICDKLLDIAFEPSLYLHQNSSLNEIADFLAVDENSVLCGINKEFSLNLKSVNEANILLEKQRYKRLNHLIDLKFTDKQLIIILSLIALRNDSEIQKLITDNADIPTIFEYVLGIIWYKISHKKGKILDYMKLSLDANLLPKTHAAGGEADIVYDYEKTSEYPAHSLLLEATLADKTNQRRMEMEPVSRHLGNHIINTQNFNSYCVFATNNLNINVVSDFRGRKNQRYYDTSDENNFIDGMKIIPLQIKDLENIIKNKIGYEKLYKIFETAFKSDLPPREWRENCIEKKLLK